MSTYATMTGWVQCTSEDDFKALIGTLKGGGWINESDQFTDEAGTPLWGAEGRHIHPELLLLEIPFFCHRNLCRIEFFPEGSKRRGMIAGSCTDGCAEVWTATPAGSVSRDLKEFMEGPCDPPDVEAGSDEEEQAWEDYSDALNEAECEFFNLTPIPEIPTQRA